MKDEQFKNLLLEAGLTEEEAIIYLGVLEKPAGTKWELKIRDGMEKNKVYRACEKLEKL